MCSIVIRRIWPILHILRLRKRRNDFYTETKLCLEEHQVRRGTPGNSWWRCAAQFSKSWLFFRPNIVIFHIRFQTWPLKSIPVYMSSLLLLEGQQKRPVKIHFEFIGILLFLFYSFGIETTNKFIHPVVSSKTQENHSRF